MATLESLLKALTDAQVRYVVTGGVAVVLHGHPRYAADLGLALDLEPDALAHAFTVLSSLEFAPVLPVAVGQFLDPETRAQWVRTRNLTVFSLRSPRYPVLAVDVFAAPPIPFDALWADAVEVALETTTTRIAGIAHLISMKSLADRPQDRPRDREDIERLKRIELG